MLIAIFAGSVLVYGVLSAKHSLPDLFPDELFYAKLSQSYNAGDGLLFRNLSTGLPPLWPVLLSPVWSLGSTVDAYNVAKLIGVVLASSVVFPVWLVGRPLVGPRLALIPAALSVCGAWMLVTGFIVSDNLAYPLAVGSLAATLTAIRDVRVRWVVLSVAIAVVGVLVRTQLLVLPLILLVALMIDVVRFPSGARRERFDSRPRALWITLAVAVLAVVLAFVLQPNLTTYDVFAHHASLAATAKATGKHALTTIILFGFIPIAVALALMFRARNWRDGTVGPVLVTIAASVLVLMPVLGRFEVFATAYPVDRYSMYLAPLFFLALVLAYKRAQRRDIVIASLVLAGLCLLMPRFGNQGEQPGLYGTQHLFGKVVGEHGFGLKLGVAVVALGAGLLAAWLLTAAPKARGFAGALVLLVGILIAQNAVSQAETLSSISDGRPIIAPQRLDWVDATSDGPVAVLNVGKPEAVEGNYDLFTDFFNKSVTTNYFTSVGRFSECRVLLRGNHGVLKQLGGGCAPWPRNYVVLDAAYKTTLAGQQVLARTKKRGNLVRVPPGPPRVLALVRPPCKFGCEGAVKLGLYLDAPGRVDVTFGPAPEVHLVNTGKRVHILQPDQPNTLHVHVPAGDSSKSLLVDWTAPENAPHLRSVVLHSAGKTQRLY